MPTTSWSVLVRSGALGGLSVDVGRVDRSLPSQHSDYLRCAKPGVTRSPTIAAEPRLSQLSSHPRRPPPTPSVSRLRRSARPTARVLRRPPAPTYRLAAGAPRYSGRPGPAQATPRTRASRATHCRQQGCRPPTRRRRRPRARQRIQPSVASLTPREIQDATGLSMSYPSKIKRGINRRHPRHWNSLVKKLEEA
jgi:hypothetical protein